jgi:hypothetical protein
MVVPVNEGVLGQRFTKSSQDHAKRGHRSNFGLWKVRARGRRNNAIKARAPAGTNGNRFRGEKRSNETHESSTDPDAPLYRKSNGQESRLCTWATPSWRIARVLRSAGE